MANLTAHFLTMPPIKTMRASTAPRKSQYLGAVLLVLLALLAFCISPFLTAEGAVEPAAEQEEGVVSGALDRNLDATCEGGESSSAIQGLYDFVAQTNTESTNEIVTRYFVYGDMQTCPTDTDRFTLTIQYNGFSDVDWSLKHEESRRLVMDLASTRPQSWANSFDSADSLVFRVDRCLQRGSTYRLWISSSDSIATQLYEITTNGISIASGNDMGDIMSAVFDSQGSMISISQPPSEAPVAANVPPPPISRPSPVPNSQSVENAPYSPPQNDMSFCFSGSTTVYVKGRGRTKMSNLKIGDEVAVRSNGDYEPVYSFGHYEPMGQAIFLEISTSQTSLRVSRDHLIFVCDQRQRLLAVPAASISVGDSLVLYGDNRAAVVESITPLLVRDGFYAPFTPSGKLLVNNGHLVSSFISFDLASSKWSIGAVGVSYQWLAHSFEFPHRVFCYYFGKCPGESYTSEGLSEWVAVPLEVALWILKLEPSLSKTLLFASIVSLCLIFNGVELLLFLHPYPMLVLVGLWFSARLTTRKIF